MPRLYSHPHEYSKKFLANYLCIGFVPGGIAMIIVSGNDFVIVSARMVHRPGVSGTPGGRCPGLLQMSCCLLQSRLSEDLQGRPSRTYPSSPDPLLSSQQSQNWVRAGAGNGPVDATVEKE